jgi:deubiquitinase DESI2
LNKVSKTIGAGGLFHAGVEVYGKEWAFGLDVNPTTGTALYAYEPKLGCTVHSFRESIEMGNTALSEYEVTQLISSIRGKWTAASYDMYRNNCCTFANGMSALYHVLYYLDGICMCVCMYV